MALRCSAKLSEIYTDDCRGKRERERERESSMELNWKDGGPKEGVGWHLAYHLRGGIFGETP